MRFTPQMSLVLPMAIRGILTIPGVTAHCSDGLVNVVFNSDSHDKVSQFSQMPGASNWLTFAFGTQPKQIPMLGNDKDAVDKAIAAVNGPNPPDYLLTFNEPDHDYKTGKVILHPKDAADLIKPLLKSPGKKTKFIAPVPANQTSSWLFDFYNECKCRDFFAAHNVHIYRPTVEEAKAEINAFREKYNDKPLWISEIAPGQSTPRCPQTIPWDKSIKFMQEIYSWGQSNEWIHKIFWNSGNQINCNDTNVAASYLLDYQDKPTPLLDPFNHLTCM